MDLTDKILAGMHGRVEWTEDGESWSTWEPNVP